MQRENWVIEWKGYTIKLGITDIPKVSSHIWSIYDRDKRGIDGGHMCNMTRRELENYCKDQLVAYEKRTLGDSVREIERERKT